jgi:16S rRNA (adenine1518-N6/adenine1519-N6)-dimethyltransferase
MGRTIETSPSSDGFRTKKSLGQHFLTDPAIARRIALEGGLAKGDVVLEIGPGTGNLTVHLLETGATVVAVEPDERAIHALRDRFSAEISQKRLILSHNDIREVDFGELGLVDGSFTIIANIPYYISGLLFRMALSGSVKPKKVIFLVQKEVAERIARAKKESLLSLSVKAYGTPRYAFTVRKGSFSPQPKVDSAVIVIDSVSRNRFADVSEETFFELIHTGFGARRKQLYGLLKQKYEPGRVHEAFQTLSIPEKVRGEDIHIDTWIALAKYLK